VIETERLILRLPEPADAEELGAIYGEPETMRFVGGTIDPQQMPTQIESMRRRWDELGFGTLVLERREDGRVVGDVGVYAWETATWDNTRDLSLPHEIEIGWLLGGDYRGAGYATEAGRGLRDWARQKLAPERLISLIGADNEPSTAVARRLGCVRSGSIETAKYGVAEVWVHPE
jgi:RimJ/RimL family protein N-acetyltransferase